MTTPRLASRVAIRRLWATLYRDRANLERLPAKMSSASYISGGIILDTKRSKRRYNYPKVDASYPVLVLTGDGPLRGRTKHISTRQAFVRCKDPLRLYDVANMTIQVSKNESLVAEAEVIYSNRYGPDDEITPRGMLVRFTSLSGRDRQRLQHAIVRHYRAKMSGGLYKK